MYFPDFESRFIKENSVFDGKFYTFSFGLPIEVTTVKSQHQNRLASGSLAKDMVEDKLMVRYTPANTVRFTKKLIDNDSYHVSCKIDETGKDVIIGAVSEFGMSTGMLAFSGFLSANGLVEKERPVYCSDRLCQTIRDRVRILGVGVRGDDLFGLYYLPGLKDLFLGDKNGTGITTTVYRSTCNVPGNEFYLKDWFSQAKVRV